VRASQSLTAVRSAKRSSDRSLKDAAVDPDPDAPAPQDLGGEHDLAPERRTTRSCSRSGRPRPRRRVWLGAVVATRQPCRLGRRGRQTSSTRHPTAPHRPPQRLLRFVVVLLRSYPGLEPTRALDLGIRDDTPHHDHIIELIRPGRRLSTLPTLRCGPSGTRTLNSPVKRGLDARVVTVGGGQKPIRRSGSRYRYDRVRVIENGFGWARRAQHVPIRSSSRLPLVTSIGGYAV
jgi:hypothetical protein